MYALGYGSIVINIEGVRVEAKAIPKQQIVSMWKELTTKPFPRVKAFQLVFSKIS